MEPDSSELDMKLHVVELLLLSGERSTRIIYVPMQQYKSTPVQVKVHRIISKMHLKYKY